jgi:hypothetical protein
LGRRLDFNFYPSIGPAGVNITGSNDTTTTGFTRLLLQGCLWAGRKI